MKRKKIASVKKVSTVAILSQIKIVKWGPFITLTAYISQENQCFSEKRKKTEAEKLEGFAVDETKTFSHTTG